MATKKVKKPAPKKRAKAKKPQTMLDVLEFIAMTLGILTSGQKMLSERLESLDTRLSLMNEHFGDLNGALRTQRTLADHCARLLKEKETLQRRLATQVPTLKETEALAQANRYMSRKRPTGY